MLINYFADQLCRFMTINMGLYFIDSLIKTMG